MRNEKPADITASYSGTDRDDLVANATPEQLAACVRILAENVARFRLQFHPIPLSRSALHASPDPSGDPTTKILKEVFDLVSEKDQPPVHKPKLLKQARLIEQRQYTRISARIPIRVSLPGSGLSYTGRLNDLSWGGASFTASGLASAVGDEIQLDLPFTHDAKDISITARILRTWNQPEGPGFGVRFTSLTPEDDKRLEHVLHLLLEQKNGDRREHPRLARRIEVEYMNDADWQATLENISEGGMCLTLPDPFTVNQSVQLMLSETARSISLTLRGRIVHVKEIAFGEANFYQVRLEFEHPNDVLQQSVKSLLQSIVIPGKNELPKVLL